MVEFLASFFTADTLMLIPVFIVLLAIAIKEVVDFCDWLHDRGKKHYSKEDEINTQITNINRLLTERDTMDTEEQDWIDNKFTKIDEEFDKINITLAMLIDSDKEDIRSYVLEKWMVYCLNKKPIDTHTMECLEARFLIYKQEGGNSFVENLMDELRDWHRQCLDVADKKK